MNDCAEDTVLTWFICMVMILIWQFGKIRQDYQIKCIPFTLQTWVSFHAVLKKQNTANVSLFGKLNFLLIRMYANGT